MATITNITRAKSNSRQWSALIEYVDGSTTVVDFDQFSELGSSIEQGPQRNLIARIQVAVVRDKPIGKNPPQSPFENEVWGCS